MDRKEGKGFSREEQVKKIALWIAIVGLIALALLWHYFPELDQFGGVLY